MKISIKVVLDRARDMGSMVCTIYYIYNYPSIIFSIEYKHVQLMQTYLHYQCYCCISHLHDHFAILMKLQFTLNVKIFQTRTKYCGKIRRLMLCTTFLHYMAVTDNDGIMYACFFITCKW